MEQLIRVLIVDDSAYTRKVLRQLLSRSPFIEVVGSARDGAEALELAERLRPDVVTLDLIMPGTDGLAFLAAQMARRPIPVVLVSSAPSESALALRALDAGAVELVCKPTALATEQIYEMGGELIAKVKAAAQAAPGRALRQPLAPPARPPGPVPPRAAFRLLVIGISTGGPQALKRVIPQLPAGFPLPIAVVMHMPVGYTAIYAQTLAERSPLGVREAAEGSELLPGTVLIAPAGRHLSLHKPGPGPALARLSDQPADTIFRPSVDVLFRSAAELFGRRTLGLVMTGMGADGVQGAAAIKASGGTVWTEAEESCVIYGMPRAVVEAGLSDRQLPLDALALALQEL